jgi:hypothetical protein
VANFFKHKELAKISVIRGKLFKDLFHADSANLSRFEQDLFNLKSKICANLLKFFLNLREKIIRDPSDSEQAKAIRGEPFLTNSFLLNLRN